MYYGPAGVAPLAGTPGIGNIYRSTDACDNFTRITPRCPGVSAGGSITSLDVVQCPVCSTGCQDPNMAIVGVTSFGVSTGVPTNNFGEGVYTFNQNGVAMWNDLMVSTAMPSFLNPPNPGTLPAGSAEDVIAVYGSRNYPTDGLIVAVVNDLIGTKVANPIPYGAGTYVCLYDANDGTWGGDIDSPTNAQKVPSPADGRTWVGNFPGTAAIDTGTDFNNVGSCYIFVGLAGSNIGPARSSQQRQRVAHPRALNRDRAFNGSLH
jgi:hypothetical protein